MQVGASNSLISALSQLQQTNSTRPQTGADPAVASAALIKTARQASTNPPVNNSQPTGDKPGNGTARRQRLGQYVDITV